MADRGVLRRAPFRAATGLSQIAATNWTAIDGEAALNGVNLLRLPLGRFLLAVEAWVWKRIERIHNERLHEQTVNEFERMLEPEPDEDRWGETPDAAAQQDTLGAVTPTMGFIE